MGYICGDGHWVSDEEVPYGCLECQEEEFEEDE